MLFSSFSRTRPRRENLGKCYLSLKMSSCSWYSVKSLWKRRFCPITGRSSFNSSLFRKPCTKTHKSILRMYYLISWIYLIELLKIHAFFPAWRGLCILCSYSAYTAPRIKSVFTFIYAHEAGAASAVTDSRHALRREDISVACHYFKAAVWRTWRPEHTALLHLRNTEDSIQAETVALRICLQFHMK